MGVKLFSSNILGNVAINILYLFVKLVCSYSYHRGIRNLVI